MSWDLMSASRGEKTLVAVNPALVIGPVLSCDFSASVQVEERFVSGRVPGLTRLGFCLVDVRDVANLHIRAMTAPEAAGQRFIAAGDFDWMTDLVGPAVAGKKRPGLRPEPDRHGSGLTAGTTV